MDAADVTVNFSLSGTNPKAVAHNSAVGRGGSRSVIALGGWADRKLKETLKADENEELHWPSEETALYESDRAARPDWPRAQDASPLNQIAMAEVARAKFEHDPSACISLQAASSHTHTHTHAGV